MDTALKQATVSTEKVVQVQSGWTMLPLLASVLLADIGVVIFAVENGTSRLLTIVSILLLPVCIVLLRGFFTLQPNEARVLVLFGNYRGSVRTSGFHWGNPFYTNGPQQVSTAISSGQLGKLAPSKNESLVSSRQTLGRNKISLRARTLNGDKLKVNDKRGNPKLQPSLFGGSETQRKRPLTSIIMRTTWSHRANRHCVTWQVFILTTTVKTVKSHFAATLRKSPRPYERNCKRGWQRRV